MGSVSVILSGVVSIGNQEASVSYKGIVGGKVFLSLEASEAEWQAAFVVGNESPNKTDISLPQGILLALLPF